MENIEDIDNQICILQRVIKKAKKVIARLREKRYKMIVHNKKYTLDLKEYIGKEIISLCFVLADGTVMARYNDGGLLYVDHDGRLVYVSEVCGSVRYESSIKSYIMNLSGYSKVLDIVGFFDIELGEQNNEHS